MKKYLLIFAMVFALAGCVSNASVAPKSAENMSVEERAENDSAVLIEELTEFNVEHVVIDYAGAVINIYVNRESTEQHIEDFAKDVVATVKSSLKERKSDMTIEKDKYSVIIHGKNGVIKIAST